MGQRFLGAVLLALTPILAIAQKQDSIQQVVYQQALKKMEEKDLAAASLQFTQLITSNFTNKEVFVKRGIIYFQQNDYAKAKADFDEAVK
ncbi:MAG: tetratricopeptide repeat protein, partial [Bacteroidota bacterium]